MYLCFERGRVYVTKADPNDEPFREDQAAETRILDGLREMGQATGAELADYTGRKEGSIKNLLTKMCRSKEVRVVGKRDRANLYSLSEGDG